MEHLQIEARHLQYTHAQKYEVVSERSNLLNNANTSLRSRRSIRIAVISLLAIFLTVLSVRESMYTKAISSATVSIVTVIPRDPISSTDPRLLLREAPPRPLQSRPKVSLWSHKILTSGRPLPTNAWWQSLSLCSGLDDPLSCPTQTVTFPYLIDVHGSVPGLRTHLPFVEGADTQVQALIDSNEGITLGLDISSANQNPKGPPHRIVDFGDLSVTLEWHSSDMNVSKSMNNSKHTEERLLARTHIVQGMAYSTMEYFSGAKPVIVVDQSVRFKDGSCSPLYSSNEAFLIDSKLDLLLEGADSRWLIFFSSPTWLTCSITDEVSGETTFRVLDDSDDYEIDDGRSYMSRNLQDRLVLRTAQVTDCASGRNVVRCDAQNNGNNNLMGDKWQEITAEMLSSHSAISPSGDAEIAFTDPQQEKSSMTMIMSWGSRYLFQDELAEPKQTRLTEEGVPRVEMLHYALPHHFQVLKATIGSSNTFASSSDYQKEKKDRGDNSVRAICKRTILGPACAVRGGTWNIAVSIPPASFLSPLPDIPSSDNVLSSLGAAVQRDANFQLAANYRKGSGDTYFSGKQVAKLARIGLIATELSRIGNNSTLYADIATTIEIRLRGYLRLWLSGSTRNPMMYDSRGHSSGGWGGVISCGCSYDSTIEECSNAFPQCPSLSDCGLNFGNGFYNDHHFHYGYWLHSMAALISLKEFRILQQKASHDESFSRIDTDIHSSTEQQIDKDEDEELHRLALLLVRDIANPSREDAHFPVARHKDWYVGFSWANGIAMPPNPNGRNQESSSEATQAYEAVSLYGITRARSLHREIHENDAQSKRPRSSTPDNALFEQANSIENFGLLLYSLETRSSKFYWHVLQKSPETKEGKVNVNWVPSAWDVADYLAARRSEHNYRAIKSNPFERTNAMTTSMRVYPNIYSPRVVGMLWSNLAQIQTFFGSQPFLSYGIQMLPLVGGSSDGLLTTKWMKEAYPKMKSSCDADEAFCTSEGWKIIVECVSVMAEMQQMNESKNIRRERSIAALENMDPANFESAGGGGQSLSNSIWFVLSHSQ